MSPVQSYIIMPPTVPSNFPFPVCIKQNAWGLSSYWPFCPWLVNLLNASKAVYKNDKIYQNVSIKINPSDKQLPVNVKVKWVAWWRKGRKRRGGRQSEKILSSRPPSQGLCWSLVSKILPTIQRGTINSTRPHRMRFSLVTTFTAFPHTEVVKNDWFTHLMINMAGLSHCGQFYPPWLDQDQSSDGHPEGNCWQTHGQCSWTSAMK